MEIAAVAVQQASLQTKVAMSMVKQTAENDQALLNVIQQTVRGQNLDLSV